MSQFWTNVENLTIPDFTNIYRCFTHKMMASKSMNLGNTQNSSYLFFVNFAGVLPVSQKKLTFGKLGAEIRKTLNCLDFLRKSHL